MRAGRGWPSPVAALLLAALAAPAGAVGFPGPRDSGQQGGGWNGPGQNGTGQHQTGQYLGIILGSVHIGHVHLNNFNPGLTYGRIWPGPRPRLDWFAEGGVFYNSYKEVSPIAMFGVRYDIGRLGPAEIHLGAAGGIGYYRKLSASLEQDYGIPNVAGFIPMAALSLSAQVGRTEYRLTTVPAGRDVKAIFNLSVAVHF